MSQEKLPVDAIFLAAADLPTGSERSAYLTEVCGSNSGLRERVERLLAAHSKLHSFLEAPAQALIATTEEGTREHPGSVIGSYKLLEQIGEGGFGIVFMAEQMEPIRRLVALKVVKPGMDTRQVIARFEAERQALALMDHPNIAKVLDAGTTDGGDLLANEDSSTDEISSASTLHRGRPYFIMELVRGPFITSYCDQNKLPVRERLELFIHVCQAVQHAHQKGIIHRDIKPSNVLITLHDGKPVVKVIDFGIAKAMGHQLTDKTLFTNFAQMIGTPLYMSPEQAEMSGLDFDTRCDIYSLGVLLYELLTGTTPFDQDRLRQAGFDELRRIIREEEPPRPSTRMSTVGESATTASERRQSDPRKLGRLFTGELDWIVMKALEKDRNRRYQTANGLARDVERYLADEVIEARPPSTGYRLKKLARRHRGAVLAGSLIVLAMLVGTAGTALGLVEAKHQERLAVAAQLEQTELAQAENFERRRAESAEAEAKKLEALALTQKMLAEASAEEARKQEKEARDKLALSAAITEFLEDDLLAQAGSKAQADRHFVPDPNLTVREALDRAAAAVSRKFKDRPELEASIRHTIGDAYRGIGQFDKSIAQLQQSADISVQKQGPDHLQSLAIGNCLAVAYLDGGKTAQAIALLKKVVESRSKALGAAHVETLISQNNLALAYQDAGRTAEAIALFRQIREVFIEKIGPEKPETLLTLSNLAFTYRESRRTAEAIVLLQQVRDAQTTQLGPEHPETLATLNNLALAYSDAGRFTEAIALFKKVLDSATNRLGENHPCTLGTMHNLGAAYQRAGKTTEAIALLEPARAAVAQRLGPDHPDALATINSLALAYQDAARLPEAVALFEQLRKAVDLKLGPDHPKSLVALNNLAAAYRAAGKTEEAIALFERLHERHLKKFGAEHPGTMTTLNNLAASYWQANRLDKSIPLFEQALAARRKKLGEMHPDTIHTLANLGVNYRDAGRLDEAISLLEQAHLAARELPFLNWIDNSLLTAYIQGKNNAKATVLAQDNLRNARKRSPAGSAALARTLSQIGLALLQLQDWAAAEPVIRECLTIREKQEPDSWPTFNTRSMLGEALLGQKNYAAAQPLLISGYQELRKREGQMQPVNQVRITEALERLVQFYTATENQEEAAKWRKELEASKVALRQSK